MSKPSNAEAERTVREAARELSEDEVAAYLGEHPDFFENRPDLLQLLTPPSHQRGDSVVDMQKFMIERLRQDIARQQLAQTELISTSRRNLSTQTRIHGAVLDILSANSFEHLIDIITTDLAVRLDVDVIKLCVESSEGMRAAAKPPAVRVLRAGAVDALIGEDRQIILRPTAAPEPAIFGGAATLVASEALLRLNVSSKAPAGLMAMGSRNAEAFDTNQGTELLKFLGRVIESTIRTWLELPA